MNCEGKKPGKYFWRKLKMSTWPTGVSGAIRMTAKGMKVSRSLAVRRSACTCGIRRHLMTIRSIPVWTCNTTFDSASGVLNASREALRPGQAWGVVLPDETAAA